jgi:hypothetical protein
MGRPEFWRGRHGGTIRWSDPGFRRLPHALPPRHLVAELPRRLVMPALPGHRRPVAIDLPIIAACKAMHELRFE